jgi:hypothetical protein
MGNENCFAENSYAQKLFEHHIQMKCDEASFDEADALTRNCSQQNSIDFTKMRKNLNDIDKLIEYITFKSIAEIEARKLTCLMNNFSYLKNDAKIREKVINETCSKLDLLKDILDNQAFIEKWLVTYRAANDRSLRIIEKSTFEENKKIIKILEERLLFYQSEEEVIRGTDSLLSSIKIFDEIKSKFKSDYFFSADSPKEVCTFLSKKVPEFLEEDYIVIVKSKKMIDEYIKKNSEWVEDDGFKESLWATSSRDDYFNQVLSDSSIKKSTICRMEGRYGAGAKLRDSTNYLSYIFAGIVTAELSNIAVAIAVASEEGTALTLNLARGAMGVDILGAALISTKQIINRCRDKLIVLSDSNTCKPSSKDGFYNLYSQRVAASKCLLTATTGILSVGFSAILARGALSEATLKHRFVKELTVRSAVTKKKLANYISATPIEKKLKAKTGDLSK